MNCNHQYDNAIRRIDALLRRRMAEGLSPGLSVAFTTGKELLAARAYGVANADTGEPVSERTLFQIGSITKHFTAVACLRLLEQGRLDLHAPITEILDWFEVASRFDTPLTIHHLLTHTGGLVMMIDNYPSSWWQTWSLRETGLGFAPGSRFSYSNVGYNVLQCVIQTLTGESFDAALRALIFEPLGMMESFGEVRSGLYGRMAKGHKYAAHDDRPVPRPAKQTVVNWYEMSAGCGSVVTTAADLARFLRMLLRGGTADDGSVLLRPDTFDQLVHPYAVMDGFFEGTHQGYGVLIERSKDTENRRRIIGGGENLGFEATMYGDFDAGVGAVLLGNSFDTWWKETRYAVSALVAASGGEEIPEPPALPPVFDPPLGARTAEYVGSFMSEDREITVHVHDGALAISSGGAQASLEPLWEDTFATEHPDFDQAMLQFGRSDEGLVTEAFYLGEWYRHDRYRGPRRFEVPAEWDAYVGQYRSFGILVTSFRIFIRKGQLICQSFGGYVDQPLTDLRNGWFRIGGESSPERMTFDCFAQGKALRCRASGGDFYRIE